MSKLIFILAIGFLLGSLYSFVIFKFLKNKFILFLPTLVSGLWIIYSAITLKTKNIGGFYDLAIFLMWLIVFAFMLGNVVLGLILLKKNN